MQYLYYADTAGFPYGGRTSEYVEERVLGCLSYIRSETIQAIIIACNTASTVVLPSLREHYTCPIIGVVPAIKTAAESSLIKAFTVLATPATAKRKYTIDLVEQFASHCEVVLMGCANLVHIAEQKIATGVCPMDKLKKELESLNRFTHHDALVLACTHYPLLKEEIKSLLPKNFCQVIDSGEAIARRLDSLIATKVQQRGKVIFEASANNSVSISIKKYLDSL